MAQMQIFLSHSSKAKAFADQLVAALRGAGADVWYDEHNLGAGDLRREINEQLATRPVVIVVVSKAALASQWVQDECEWAYNLYRRKPERLILPVVAAPYDMDDFDNMLFLESLKRVEAPGNQPFPPDDAIEGTLRLLELTPAGATSPPAALPQAAESASDLMAKGKALLAQEKNAEAIPFFEATVKLEPRNFDAWIALGVLTTGQAAIDATDRALALDDKSAVAWNNKSILIRQLGRYKESLTACEHALALDPNWGMAWNNKGACLLQLGRRQEALAACDHALALNPNHTFAWMNKGVILGELGRRQEALAAYDHVWQSIPNSC